MRGGAKIVDLMHNLSTAQHFLDSKLAKGLVDLYVSTAL